MDKAELIAKVLCCHPFEGDQTPEVKDGRKAIKKRYQEIRRKMPFTQAELVSKVEWLKSVL